MRPTTVVRRVVATEDVNKLVAGPWETTEWQDRCGFLVYEIDQYLNGGLVTVALDPGTDDEDCTFKRLYPAYDEVWEFRSRAPSPGIRIFGSFAETNIFIATNWAIRKDLGAFGSPEWDEAISKSHSAWLRYFYSRSLRKRGQLHDYIARQAVSVDPSP